MISVFVVAFLNRKTPILTNNKN